VTVFDDVIPAIERCAGYTINLVSLSVIEERDSLEIGLRWGPGKPDITLSMQSIYYFALERSPGADLLYVDKVRATPLPADEPWPEDFPLDLARTPDLPTLLWIRAEPVQLDVVAAVVTVLQEVR
jgi:hypothetical protein